jgi:hypothetical protein
MKVRFFDIQWDTSSDDGGDCTPKELGLPSECILEVDDASDAENEGAVALSDKHGFCVSAFD